ncbi:MAG: EscU/YscU/HrcU family type III secretion system export apparatus switch protein, partial [Vulcanimicrobiaceae bacterium]
MNDANGEKHFEATPSRIAKARREGNIARAGEFGANAAFIAAAIALVGVSGSVASAARRALEQAAAGKQPVAASVEVLAWACVPMTCAALAGALASLVQNGGWQWIAVVPKLERMQPLESIKRMLSRETLTHALRATIAFAVSAAAIVPTLRDLLSGAANGGSLPAIASAAWAGAQHAVAAAAAVGLGFAIVEYGIARRAWLQKLRMSFDDLKRELREHDGDPLARGRRKALHRSLAHGAVSSVARAAFVVVNPSHVAVALEYRPPLVPVPRV